VKTVDDKLYIRANQGHTQEVPDLELVKITNTENYPLVVHGTYKKHWNNIKKGGLSRMSRNHIHFATGIFGDKEVISGMRSSCDMYIYIDLAEAIKDNIDFFLSANGVLLTEGINGVLPPRNFSHVLKAPQLIPFDIDFPERLPGANDRE